MATTLPNKLGTIPTRYSPLPSLAAEAMDAAMYKNFPCKYDGLTNTPPQKFKYISGINPPICDPGHRHELTGSIHPTLQPWILEGVDGKYRPVAHDACVLDNATILYFDADADGWFVWTHGGSRLGFFDNPSARALAVSGIGRGYITFMGRDITTEALARAKDLGLRAKAASDELERMERLQVMANTPMPPEIARRIEQMVGTLTGMGVSTIPEDVPEPEADPDAYEGKKPVSEDMKGIAEALKRIEAEKLERIQNTRLPDVPDGDSKKDEVAFMRLPEYEPVHHAEGLAWRAIR